MHFFPSMCACKQVNPEPEPALAPTSLWAVPCLLLPLSTLLLGPLVLSLSTHFLFFCPHSKQRHNKLWRQQTKSSLQPPMDDPAEPSNFLPETLDSTLADSRLPCLDDAAQPGLPGSPTPGGPALPCCLRRLSDPLHSSSDYDTGSPVHLEDLERDALLEDVTQPVEVLRPARRAQEGAGLCEKGVKKKLELGGPRAHSGSSPQAEDMEREEGPRPGRSAWPPAQPDRSPLNRENLNNNNSKRSCPDDFEVGLAPCCCLPVLLSP